MRQVLPQVGTPMDLHAPVLGIAPLLMFHATGAVTFVGPGEADWDDDAAVLYVAEA